MRDHILREKDRVQKRLWREAGKDTAAYVALVHDRARELRKSGVKLRYVRGETVALAHR
jgi:hypothetical protein